jgi:hypothetical protein
MGTAYFPNGMGPVREILNFAVCPAPATFQLDGVPEDTLANERPTPLVEVPVSTSVQHVAESATGSTPRGSPGAGSVMSKSSGES